MQIADPRFLLDAVDFPRLDDLVETCAKAMKNTGGSVYVEPCRFASDPASTRVTEVPKSQRTTSPESASDDAHVRGKIQRLGDNVDTDAIIPAEFIISATTNKDLGVHCMEHTYPEFRRRVRGGFNVVVAGESFGCGSSREQAVQALLGCGPNLGLLGITITDLDVYDLAVDGAPNKVDLSNRYVAVGNGDTENKRFPFHLSNMERRLIECGGISPAFNRFGKKIFESLCVPRLDNAAKNQAESLPHRSIHALTQW